MVRLCLMASHGYRPGLVLPQEQGMNRVVKDCQPYLPSQGARQEVIRSDCLNLRLYQSEEPRKPISGWCKSNQLVKFDSTVTRGVLVDVQDTRPDSVLFSLGIAKQCARHEKIMQFLVSIPSETEGAVLDLSLLSDLMGCQTLAYDAHQQLSAPSLIYPPNKSFDQKPLLDFVGDMICSSKITIHPDGRVLFAGSGAEMNDFLSFVAEFYISKNATKWSKQSLLIPHFDRLPSSEALANTHGSSLRMEAITFAPLKSPEKIKIKPPAKKNSKKIGRARHLYKRNYFHACENLLSLMISKREYRKTAILSLKKSGPELSKLLTQLSTGIAGTGLAVLFFVICKVGFLGVPFCGYEVLNAGLALGLVALSWAVNELRDTIVYVSKNKSKMGLKDEMKRVNNSVNDIYFRAATLMAVAVLRLA